MSPVSLATTEVGQLCLCCDSFSGSSNDRSDYEVSPSYSSVGGPERQSPSVSEKGSSNDRSDYEVSPPNNRVGGPERQSPSVSEKAAGTVSRASVEPASNSRRKIKAEVKLIVLSYWRSGSTLTGDVYNHHSKVFYVYEPLLSLQIHYIEKKSAVTFFNRDPIDYDPTKVQGLQLEVVNQSVNCAFESMYTKILLSKVMRRNSVDAEEYSTCMGKTTPVTTTKVLECLPLLSKHCAPAQAIVTKVVRMSMEVAEQLLRDDPKVKVVHLIRDPRGVLQSMESSGLNDRYHLQSHEFCNKVLKDLKGSVPLKQTFPGRVMTIRYEDLAEKPLDFSARLLRFAGLDMEPSLRDYVWNITSSHSDDLRTTKFNTVRSDSSAAASAWRDTISSKLAGDVSRNCGELFRLVGYMPLPSIEQIRDRTLPYYDPDYTAAPIGLWVEK